jgi:hypothetical protein
VARQISGILLNNDLQVITFANTRLITEVLVKYLKNDFEKSVTDVGKSGATGAATFPANEERLNRGCERVK